MAADARRAAPPRRAREPQARRAADAPGRAVGHGAPAQGQDDDPRAGRRDRRRTSCAATSRPAAPNRLWVADLTEVPTWEGKLYLAVVIDCFSRRCVGWAMAEHMRAELVVEALEMAVWQRQPDAGLVHHSDRGGQYAALIFGQRCRAGRHRPSRWAPGLRAGQRRLRELLRLAQEGAHPPALVADAPRARRPRSSLDRGLVQPPPTALHARLPLARRLREQNSERTRYRPRRFAARTLTDHDQGEGCIDQPQRVHRSGSGPRRAYGGLVRQRPGPAHRPPLRNENPARPGSTPARLGALEPVRQRGAGTCGTVDCCFERVGQTHPWEVPSGRHVNRRRKGAGDGCGGGAVRGS